MYWFFAFFVPFVFVCQTCFMAGMPAGIDRTDLMIGALSPSFVYIFDFVSTESSEDKSRKSYSRIRSYRLFGCIVAFAHLFTACYLAAVYRRDMVARGSGALVLTYLYTHSFAGLPSIKRAFLGSKCVFVATMWLWWCMDSLQSFRGNHLRTGCMWMHMAMLTALNDIKDIDDDRRAGIATFANRWGGATLVDLASVVYLLLSVACACFDTVAMSVSLLWLACATYWIVPWSSPTTWRPSIPVNIVPGVLMYCSSHVLTSTP